jgi:hypothetical protein
MQAPFWNGHHTKEVVGTNNGREYISKINIT